MKKALFISPHFPPANAPDHQRIRMALPHLSAYGWDADVLCVNPQHVDKPIDAVLLSNIDTSKVFAADLAFESLFSKIEPSALGWRSLFALDRYFTKHLAHKAYDIVYFSTTIFMVMMLGPRWLRRYNLPYVIDMHDPWYTTYYQEHPEVLPPGGSFKFGLANQVAKFLEPQVVTHAAGITSVSASYLQNFQKRYPWLNLQNSAVIPFGAAAEDFYIAEQQDVSELMLKPHAYWCSAGRGGADLKRAVNIFVNALETLDASSKPRAVFLGTSYLKGTQAKPSITPLLDSLAQAKLIEEYPERLSFFSALKLLKESQANIILGSDDSAYNPSKLANVILARRPIIAIVKHDCPAAFILKKHPRAIVILFDHQTSDEALALNLGQQLRDDSFFQANPVDLPEDLLALVDAQVQTRTMLSILDKACR